MKIMLFLFVQKCVETQKFLVSLHLAAHINIMLHKDNSTCLETSKGLNFQLLPLYNIKCLHNTKLPLTDFSLKVACNRHTLSYY